MPADAVTLMTVTKRFGAVRALERVSAVIAAGETVALWGPNGAGKTTLLRCLLGVVPFEGTISVFGHDVRARGQEARRLMGYVPQEQSLQSEQTVRETLAFFARLRRVGKAALTQLIEMWELGALLGKPIQALSGGMKQRVALAVALLGDPPLLLLDEPTSHFDMRTRQTFTARLEALARAGKTLVLCSHRASEVERLANRVLVLNRGRLEASGAPEALRETLHEGVLLGLMVRAGQETQAAALLTQRGWSVAPDGRQLWVTDAGARQAEVLRLLTEAHIDVLEVEVDAPRSARNGGAA